MSIKRGLLDSVCDTVQIFGDHGYAPSAEIIEIKPPVKEDSVSNTTKDIDEHGYSELFLIFSTSSLGKFLSSLISMTLIVLCSLSPLEETFHINVSFEGNCFA